MDSTEQRRLADWLARRPSALILRSPAGERFSANEDWTLAESWTPAVHRRALEVCERALRRAERRARQALFQTEPSMVAPSLPASLEPASASC